MRPIMSQVNQDKPKHDHRGLAAKMFNSTRTIMDLDTITSEQIDEMIHTAHASAYHWLQAGNLIIQARGHWQISRAYRLLNNRELTQQYINQALSIPISEKETRELLESDLATICTAS